MTSWVKAGLLGGVVLSLLYVLNAVSSYIAPAGAAALACCCGMMLVYLLACGGTGALAAHWLPAPRDAGTAAGRGALAGGLAGLIGGAVNAVAMMIQSATLDYAEVISQLPTETLDALKQVGITPDMIESSGGTIGGLLSGACCCGVGVIVALILGAIGGAIWAAVRPNA
jgi:hypothetical protein